MVVTRLAGPVLIIAAHPDDEVLGCGGTIARLAKEGQEVYIAILGEGVTARYPQRKHADRALVKRLHAQSHRVAKLLGVREVFLFELPDNRFDTLPLLDVVKIIEGLLARLRPRIIYTHHGGDLNIDHAVVYRASITATRPMNGCCVQEIYTFEIPSSTEWTFGQFAPVFQPNVFVDTSATLNKKLQAMQLYHNEVRLFPHPRSPEALRVIAKRWGSVVGMEAAEAFTAIRILR